jgi:hypothetical protein
LLDGLPLTTMTNLSLSPSREWLEEILENEVLIFRISHSLMSLGAILYNVTAIDPD